jgi:predicted ATPase
MKIKRVVIENFKSIERIELVEPNPFTVFVGPNGSGKSTVFEALEFVNIRRKLPEGFYSLFGGPENLQRRQSPNAKLLLEFEFDDFKTVDKDTFSVISETTSGAPIMNVTEQGVTEYVHPEYNQFIANFSRLFVNNDKLVKLPLNDNQRLSLSAKNLEKVLKRVLTQQVLKNEIFEWLELFVPEFKSVEVVANPFSGEETLLWHEQYADKPFTKDLISDGTYNILAMLTAVYQSDDKPQFLCIEEPENGLHPQVAGELVDFFRIMCEERGHHIWLNTHSQSMIARLKPEEMIVVEKKQGKTQTTQYQGRDFHGLRMDEVLLMNVLGGGLPW